MFQWDKSITSISIPAGKVVNLYRSMRDVQMALPGVPAQLATAFVCQYHWQDGIATVAVFHLHKNALLAFYNSNPRVVPAAKSDRLLDQCLNFVESMGFLLTDQDIHLLEPSDQEMLWASLPLVTGLQDEARPVEGSASGRKDRARTAAVQAATESPEAVPDQQVAEPADITSGTAEPQPAEEVAGQAPPESAAEAESADNVDDLLAAVEALRNRSSGLPARRSAPSEQELARRRSELCQTVGRILASL